MKFLLLLIICALGASSVAAVKQEDWKTCAQSSFCRRLRSIGARQAAAPEGSFLSPYRLENPVSTTGSAAQAASWTWPLKSNLYPSINFELRVDILAEGEGIARIRVDEIQSSTPFRRYNETAKWAFLKADPGLGSARLTTSSGTSTIFYGPSSSLSLVLTHSPLKIVQFRNGRPEIVFNDRSLFHMEHFRIKEMEKLEEVVGDGEQMVLKGDEMDRSWFEDSDREMFEEKFKQWTDSKPKGELTKYVPC